MLKKQWQSLKPGNVIYASNRWFIVHSLSADKLSINTLSVTGYIADETYRYGQGNNIPIDELKRVHGIDNPWSKYSLVEVERIPKGSFGRMANTGEYLMTTEEFNPSGNLLVEVQEPHGKRARIPHYIFIQDHTVIGIFSSKLTYKAPRINRTNEILGHSVGRVATYDSPTIRHFAAITAILQDSNGYNNLLNAEVCVPYFNLNRRCKMMPIIKSYNTREQPVYFDLHQLVPICAKTTNILSKDKKVEYIGKDFQYLKNGDQCIVTNIKSDYSSNKLNIVSIRNMQNGYETRVFQKNLKLINIK